MCAISQTIISISWEKIERESILKISIEETAIKGMFWKIAVDKVFDSFGKFVSLIPMA